MSTNIINTFQETGKRFAASHQNFVPQEVRDSIEDMTEEQLNALDFGVVKLADDGKILFYNEYESRLAGVDPEHARGKNFFFEIAPCTNNRLFLGSFKAGVEAKEIHVLFFYTFTYKMKPTNVKVVFYRKPGSSNNWMLIKKNL
jgi:photoactive yellow protein